MVSGSGAGVGHATRTLSALTGALLARQKVSAPRLGLPGCRAPDGVFRVACPVWPPSKSNSYRRSANGRMHLTSAVTDFQQRLAAAIVRSLDALDYRMEWFLPRGRKTPTPLNPLFGADVEVDARLLLFEPYRSRRDTDGVWKVTLDALTALGVLHDDVQIGDLACRRIVGQFPADGMALQLQARACASWARNPRGRPLSTQQIQRLCLAVGEAASGCAPALPSATQWATSTSGESALAEVALVELAARLVRAERGEGSVA